MKRRRLPRSLAIALPLASVAACAVFTAAQTASTPASPGDPLIAAFKSTYAASVSDAVEIVTGRNGTVRAAEVLKEAQSIDARESGMYPFIRQFNSLQEAVRKFNRI